jgi:hypothetical protein
LPSASQLSPIVGHVAGNADKARGACVKAAAAGAELVLSRSCSSDTRQRICAQADAAGRMSCCRGGAHDDTADGRSSARRRSKTASSVRPPRCWRVAGSRACGSRPTAELRRVRREARVRTGSAAWPDEPRRGERNEHPLALPASPASSTMARRSASNTCHDQLSNFATTKPSLWSTIPPTVLHYAAHFNSTRPRLISRPRST